MSVKLMAMVWDMDMKAVDKIILLALADYADDDGVCWPKQGTVAIKTGVTRQTVNQKMKQMEESGLLEKKDGKTILLPVKEADRKVRLPDRSVKETDSHLNHQLTIN
jgi:predicted transcriptional regulator